MDKIQYRFTNEFLWTERAQKFCSSGIYVNQRPLSMYGNGVERKFHQAAITFLTFSECLYHPFAFSDFFLRLLVQSGVLYGHGRLVSKSREQSGMVLIKSAHFGTGQGESSQRLPLSAYQWHS